MNMRRIILALMLSVIISASAFHMPSDGEKQDVWQVSGECAVMPEGFGPGSIWDLSDAVNERHFERIHRIYGDTLMTRTSEGLREMFLLGADTVRIFSYNNRIRQMRSVNSGIPYLFDADYGHVSVLSDSLRLNQTYDETCSFSLNGNVSVRRSGGFIFATGDTVGVSTLIHTVISDGYSKRDLYRWYANGVPYPIVEYSCTGVPDSSDSVLTTMLSPPSEQPVNTPYKSAPKILSHSANAEDNYSDMDSSASKLSLMPYEVMCDDEFIGVGFLAGDGIICETVICDALGRIYYSSSGDFRISTVQFPPGTYILNITVGKDTFTHKVSLR